MDHVDVPIMIQAPVSQSLVRSTMRSAPIKPSPLGPLGPLHAVVPVPKPSFCPAMPERV